jgi:hypothetical protein
LGNGDIAPRILNLDTRWREKERMSPLVRRLGGLQSWSGGGGEEINFQPVPGFEPPNIQPVA